MDIDWGNVAFIALVVLAIFGIVALWRGWRP